MKTIAILGFGASGVSFITRFIDEIKKHGTPISYKVLIFEADSKQMGTGLAYKNIHSSMLLNSSAYYSRIGSKAEDFHSWVLENNQHLLPEFGDLSGITLNSYLPRKVFGLYTADTFQKTLEDAKKIGLEITTIVDQVVNVTNFNSQSVVVTRNTGVFNVDTLIFSTGHSEKPSPFKPCDHDNFFSSPYQIDTNAQKFKNNARILVVGSRLSAIDTVMLLSKNKCTITIASQSGLMPMVKHLDKDTVTPRYSKLEQLDKFKKLNAKSVFELIKIDLNYKYKDYKLVQNLIAPSLSALTNFNQSLELAKRNILLWQDVFTPYNNYFDTMWSQLNEDEKSIFLKDYFPIITRFTSSFPLENAIKMKELINKGYLSISGGLHDVKQAPNCADEFVGIFSDGRKEAYDYVICALGYDYKLNNQAMYRTLKDNGMITYNAFGGLPVDLENMEVQNHSFSTPVYSLGSPIFGTRIFTNVLSTNAMDAGKISSDILKSDLLQTKKLA